MSGGINTECRVCGEVGGSNGRALLNDLICVCVCVCKCVCACMSISTLRQYSTALCRWMWNRSRRLAALYKYIITIPSRSSAQSGSERNVNSCLRARFSSLLRSDWKMKMFHTVPPPPTSHCHPNTQTPSFLSVLIAGPKRQQDGALREMFSLFAGVFWVEKWWTNEHPAPYPADSPSFLVNICQHFSD